MLRHLADLLVSLSHSPSPFSRPSAFLLLLDPPASGAWNMAVDEALLEAAAADGQCTLRFYRWAEPTLSLGYFQAYCRPPAPPASAGCAVVRRPSGGGAILHDHRTDLQPGGPGASSAGRQPLADLSSGSPVADRGIGASGESRQVVRTVAGPTLRCVHRCRRSSPMHQAETATIAPQSASRFCASSGGRRVTCWWGRQNRRQRPAAMPRGRAATRQPAVGPVRRRPGTRWLERIVGQGNCCRRTNTGVVGKACRGAGHHVAPGQPFGASIAARPPSLPPKSTAPPPGRISAEPLRFFDCLGPNLLHQER